eukprot:98359-Pyramimonas_sp.AAC.1
MQQSVEDIRALTSLLGQLLALRVLPVADGPGSSAWRDLFYKMLRAIPGQACSRHADARVVEDGAL